MTLAAVVPADGGMAQAIRAGRAARHLVNVSSRQFAQARFRERRQGGAATTPGWIHRA